MDEPAGGTKPGDVLTLFTNDGNGDARSGSGWCGVVDTYPLVPTRPESSYWCGLRTFFRSASNDPADPPTPVLLTTSARGARRRGVPDHRVGAATQDRPG